MLAQALLSPTQQMDPDRTEQVFRTLEEQIAAQLGYPRKDVTFQRAADLRYTGQAFELTVPVPGRRLDAAARRPPPAPVSAGGHRGRAPDPPPRHPAGGTYAIEPVPLGVPGSVTPEGVQTRVRTRASDQAATRRPVY